MQATGLKIRTLARIAAALVFAAAAALVFDAWVHGGTVAIPNAYAMAIAMIFVAGGVLSSSSPDPILSSIGAVIGIVATLAVVLLIEAPAHGQFYESDMFGDLDIQLARGLAVLTCLFAATLCCVVLTAQVKRRRRQRIGAPTEP